jgi:hypothetical protein
VEDVMATIEYLTDDARIAVENGEAILCSKCHGERGFYMNGYGVIGEPWWRQKPQRQVLDENIWQSCRICDGKGIILNKRPTK